jgi:hypothetical protein
MINNSDRLDKSAKSESLYKFFQGNVFLTSGNVQLKSNFSKGKESPWSLSFAGHCIKDIFKIDNHAFCLKYMEAISGSGQEANKITTLHSSSLASLLLFYSISKENPIYVKINDKEEKFIESRFEVKNEVNPASGKYSNIDVVLYGENCILYLESKFSEYLGSKPAEVKKVDYYDDIYQRLHETLKTAGVHLVDKGAKRFLKRIDGGPFYNVGLKQMISHYLGVTTELKKDKNRFAGKKVVLGEILFDFGDTVPLASDKYQTYKEAYSVLKKGLVSCAEEDCTGLIINDLICYQDLLNLESNHKYLKNLPDNVRLFYRL